MSPGVDDIDSSRGSEEADNDTTEAQSILSLADDIMSLDDTGPVDWDVIIDPELMALYEYAINHLDEDRFMSNHRRLLKDYYIMLNSQAHTMDQTSSIGFLRSRKHRNMISSKILKSLSPQKATKIEDLTAEMQNHESRDLTLERYLTGPEEVYESGSEAKSSCFRENGVDNDVSDNDERSDGATEYDDRRIPRPLCYSKI
ncbi:hypothetical protein CGCFRS4_v002126 [Colletotrichum fructicola]|nr:hypothetical protein CGCFRS4_v002126 [Colletotrichum fructicola]